MSESTTQTETVEIPGELRFSNPIPPPITVQLPFVAKPHGLKNVLLGFLVLSLGAPSVLVFAGLVFAAHAILLSVVHGLVFFAILLLLLVVGVSFTGTALTCFWDATRPDPVLEITVDGLCDHRSGLSVPWSSVRCARILGGIAVDLELRVPVASWQNPFRVGIILQRYRPKPGYVIVSVTCLDVPTHVLAYTILTLTQWNGGEAISTTSGSFDMGLKALPRRRA